MRDLPEELRSLAKTFPRTRRGRTAAEQVRECAAVAEAQRAGRLQERMEATAERQRLHAKVEDLESKALGQVSQ